MDAPVLPPSQEAIPAVVEIATNHPPTALPAISEANLSVRVLDMNFLPTAVANRSAHLPAPTVRPNAVYRLRSFRFLSQALRSVSLGHLFNSHYLNHSAAAPITAHSPLTTTVASGQVEGDSWKSWAATADIEVAAVMTTAQAIEAENKPWAEAIATQCLPQANRKPKPGPAYRISLRNQTLGYVADKNRADQLGQQLRQLIRQGTFNAAAIAPRSIDSAQSASKLSSSKLSSLAAPSREITREITVAANAHNLISIDDTMAEEIGYSPEWAAVAWANNLRMALEAEPLSVGDLHSGLKNLADSSITMQGTASWYGPYFHGRRTANGEIYNQHELTVAHKSLPFGTHLKVRNLLNDKTVVVRVNDRGPYVGERSLDLSKAAAQCLGSDDVGVIPYEAVILKKTAPRH